MKSNRGAVKRDVIGSVVAKVATMVPAALLGLLATRLLTARFGTDGLALYSLVLSIPLLLPFADLGLGGSVTELVARRSELRRTDVKRQIRRVQMILISIGAGIVCISAILYILDAWGDITGLQSRDGAIAAAIASGLFGLSVFFSLGYRILLGLQLNRIVVLTQGMVGVVSSAVVVGLTNTGAFLWVLASIPSAVQLFTSAAIWMYSKRKLAVAQFQRGREQTTQSDTSVASFALPMTVIAVATPLAFQADRIVLSHWSSPYQLAMYAAVFQLYTPLNSLIVAAGQSLWPKFTSMRVERSPRIRSELMRFSSMGGLIALVMLLGLILVGPTVVTWSTNGQVQDSQRVLSMFGCLLVFSAIQYPFGMFMMSKEGVKVQAGCIALMAFLKIASAPILADELGAIGPVFGSVSSTLICVLLPTCAWSLITTRKVPTYGAVGRHNEPSVDKGRRIVSWR